MVWVRVEESLADSIELLTVAVVLRRPPNEVLGGLVRLKLWVAVNRKRGELPAMTAAVVDHVTCLRGMARAMRKVGWIVGRRLLDWWREQLGE